MYDISIIIVSYNTRDQLGDCLATLVEGCGGKRAKTMVVDNDSTDGSAAMVARDFPDVDLTANKSNRGFASANNMALARASGRHVLLLNPDTIVSPGALAEMVRFMDATPACGYCGPRLLNPDGSHQPSARRFPTTLSSGFAMLGWSRRFPESRHSLNLHVSHGNETSFRADWLSGACLMVRAEVVRRVGLLDDGYFMYFEETDWCRRIAATGFEGWYVASAEVTHLGGQSVPHDSDVRPFSGDHPVHWVNSSRRYMVRHLGVMRAAMSIGIQIVLHALIWLRHGWSSDPRRRNKAQTAASAIGYWLTRSSRYKHSVT